MGNRHVYRVLVTGACAAPGSRLQTISSVLGLSLLNRRSMRGVMHQRLRACEVQPQKNAGETADFTASGVCNTAPRFHGCRGCPWCCAQACAQDGLPPKKGGRVGKARRGVVNACQPASPCAAPAGNPSAFHGGRYVGALAPAGINISRSLPPRTVRHLFRWRCRLLCTEHMP